MAVFSDQFDLNDPLEFEGYGIFYILVLSLATDARSMLAVKRTTPDLITICQHLEVVFAQRVADPSARSALKNGELKVIHQASVLDQELSRTLPFEVYEWEE